eukprot:scaffold155351_cov31-Tisochrysis_lutea.AAC.11
MIRRQLLAESATTSDPSGATHMSAGAASIAERKLPFLRPRVGPRAPEPPSMVVIFPPGCTKRRRWAPASAITKLPDGSCTTEEA